MVHRLQGTICLAVDATTILPCRRIRGNKIIWHFLIGNISLKKWRNQILNVRRVLVLGNSLVMIEDLMRLYESKKLQSGLWKSDIFVRDKQNVDAAVRIL